MQFVKTNTEIDSYDFLYHRLNEIGPDQFAQEIHVTRQTTGHCINHEVMLQYLNNATTYYLNKLMQENYLERRSLYAQR